MWMEVGCPMRIIGRYASLCLAVSLVVSSAGLPVFAQSISPGSLPGKILDSNLQPGAQHLDPPSSAAPTENPVVTDEEKEAPPTVDPSLSRKIFVKEILVEDFTLLNASDVNALVKPYQNRETSFLEIKDLAEKLTALYRDKGYISSRVYIPPQSIQDGVVILKAAEGRVGKINVEGGRFFRAHAVKDRVDLFVDKPFRLSDLRNSMIRINENPDVKVKAVLKAGDTPGTTDVDLTVTDHFPLHVTPFYDNLGRRIIGVQRGGLNFAHNNVTGFGDRSLTSVNWTRRSFGVVNHYELPMGKSGAKLGMDYAYSTLKLGKEFESLDVKGTAKIYSPFISQEFYNSDTLRISGELPFDFVNLRTNILDSPFSEDRVRLFRPGLNIESYDKWGNTFIRNELGIGVNLFNATLGNNPLASRQGAGSKFFRYTGFLTRSQRLPLGTYGIFRAITQLSPDRLVSNEQMQVGGAFTVRGYREGILIGDNGLVLSAEWRAPFFLVPKTWKIPKTDYVLRDNIQLVSFADYGSSFTNRPAPGVGRSEYIMGIGMGLRAKLTRFVVGRVDFGWPLLTIDRQPGLNPHNNPRLHFGLQSEIF